MRKTGFRISSVAVLATVFAALVFAVLPMRFALAIEPFVVGDIQVEGNQKIESGAVFSYLPVKVGDEMDDALARNSIKTLFQTGFFRDVSLRQEGSTLVVVVSERPSIAKVTLEGNKDIKTEDIEGMLEQAEITRGRILNQRRLTEVVQAMTEAYFARGRYSATVEPEVTELEDNRASIVLRISEGRVAHIREISFIGNEAVSERKLKSLMHLTDKRGFNPLSRRDLYSKPKLEGDIENIREYYTDNGFFEFDVLSSNVTISPNKQDIFINISLHEGALYELGALRISGSGAAMLSEEKQAEVLEVKDQGLFSRKQVEEIRKSISDELANAGFARAEVRPVPGVDKAAQRVDINFVAEPGQRIYVRRIDIVGNTVTQDEVIRRELRQFESGWFSAADIQRSQERLRRLGHFESVQIDTQPVPGVADQVDLQVTVAERNTGSFNFGIGYSDAEGMLLQVGYAQRNFLGTGREVSLTLDNSDVTDTYEFRYTNPYYTEDGVSRSLWLKSKNLDATEASTAEYVADTLELGVDYRIPVTEYHSVNITFFGENIQLSETGETPPELETFIKAHPDNDNWGTRLSFAKDTLNDFIFPSKGALGRISLESSLPGSDLSYYKVNLTGSAYLPLGVSGMSLKGSAKFGFGGTYGDNTDEPLPFYKNYYAGGPSSVRGYNSRSLGPKDTGDTPSPLGGDRRALFNIELLSAPWGSAGSKDKRVGLFADAGMVFGSEEDVEWDSLRYSAGVVLHWYSPLGPFSLSYGVPLNEEEDDDTEKFQISLGTLFR